MKLFTFKILSVFFLCMVSCASLKAQEVNVSINADLELIKIDEGVYIHRSFTNASFGRFSSNGLIVIKNNEVLLIDTPMSSEETEVLYNYLKNEMNAKITRFIGGHYHEDCIGGINFLKEKGVQTLLGEQTKLKCIELNLSLPDSTFEDHFVDRFQDIKFECAYLGGGHTIDNIVIYFPNNKLLFGGCLIKSMGSNNMGNVSDAVPSQWVNTVRKVKKNYPDVELVVPGHGKWGGVELLDFTINLAVKNFEQNE